MCTVTVVPVRRSARLACNRDEQHSRPGALPPRIVAFGQRRAVLPVDPTSGGTWVAANDAGLALALINVNLAPGRGRDCTPQRPAAQQSRGAIISSLLACGALARVITRAQTLDATAYAPFRLVLASREELAELRSDRRRVWLVRRTSLTEPHLFTSSGLGDHLVEGPRRRLFAECYRGAADWPSCQDAYHRHRWPERPHLSVSMCRADARTVSHTVVSLGPDRVTLTYQPDLPDQRFESVSVTLPLAAGGMP